MSSVRPIGLIQNLEITMGDHAFQISAEFKDVFALSYEDMKGLHLKFYQHQIHLSKDVKLVAQRHYRMKPKYAIKVKEEIDK